jgi:ribosome-binding protein aMBF1 (putative translation factor)
MHSDEWSDDPKIVWLSPEMVRAARALLRWSEVDLAHRSGVDSRDIQLFENYGVMLDVNSCGAIKRVLLRKCELSIIEGQDGARLKAGASENLGPGAVVFGGPLKRRPKL